MKSEELDQQKGSPIDELPTEWRLVHQVLACGLVRTVIIYGDPGTGKTYAAYNYGRVTAGFYAVTLTIDTSAAEVRGHFVLRGGDAIWHDGPFVRAMREGKRLVINEISHAGPDVLALLFPILESEQTCRLTLPTGETVRPAPGFHVVVTDNHSPDTLPEPLQDRFVAILPVSAPHPGAFTDLDEELRVLAMRGLRIKDERRISARAWRNIAILSRPFGREVACVLTFGPERGQMVYDAIRFALATARN